MQFLIESAGISCVGGILGVLTGYGGSRLLSKVLNMPVNMTASVVLIAVGFSILVGVIFGMYPANKASKLNPIDALRFE
jgi:putative ABC transport system permease protein